MGYRGGRGRGRSSRLCGPRRRKHRVVRRLGDTQIREERQGRTLLHQLHVQARECAAQHGRDRLRERHRR